MDLHADSFPYQARGKNISEHSSLSGRHPLGGIHEQPELLGTDLPLSALAAKLCMHADTKFGSSQSVVEGVCKFG